MNAAINGAIYLKVRPPTNVRWEGGILSFLALVRLRSLNKYAEN